MGFGNWLNNTAKDIWGSTGLSHLTGSSADNEFRDVDPNGALGRESDAASGFADQGQRGFNQLGNQAQQQIRALKDLQEGKNSVSAEQLRQGLQQNLASQQAFAASARPGNSAMAARTGAIQANRAAGGLAGQQAIAGLAERNQATQNLSGFIDSQRQQELQAALGSRQNALSGLGTIENARSNRFTGITGTPTGTDKLLSAGMGVATLAASDRLLKTNVAPGGAAADALISGLRPYRFEYKDPAKHGQGEHLGIMAQDLERSKLGRQAVVNTPGGKAVHGAKAATLALGGLARIGERVAKLEKKTKK